LKDEQVSKHIGQSKNNAKKKKICSP